MGARELVGAALLGMLCTPAWAAEAVPSPQQHCTSFATEQETRPFSANLYRGCVAAAEQGRRLAVRPDVFRFASGARF